SPRALHSAAYLNGKIHVWGGTTDGTGPAASSHVVFDTMSPSWTDAVPVPAPAAYAAAFVHSGYVYSVGGAPDYLSPIATATTLRYDPITNPWSDVAMADLPQPRMSSIGSTSAFQGQLVVVGGSDTSVISWDPTANTWDPLPSTSIPHSGGIGGAIGDTFYVSSGTSTEKYTCSVGPTPTPTPTPTPSPEVTLEFGDQNVGTMSASQSISLINGGTTEIVMGTPTFADGSQFALVSDPNGTVVAPGGEISIGFVFSPTSAGPKTDTVVVQSSAGSGPVIGLTGNGIDPAP